MDQLYAPWRIEWVEREADPIDGCPFCVLPERAADASEGKTEAGDGHTDRDARIVARGEYTYLLLNNAPYNPGHAMVIPYDHVGAWGDLPDAAMLEHGQLKAATIAAMEAAMGPDGVNTGMNLGGSAAGGSIDDHLHTHVIPRWTGDTNFMPVVSDTKVIVEAVDRTWEHLRDTFADLDCAVDGTGTETGMGTDTGTGTETGTGTDTGTGTETETGNDTGTGTETGTDPNSPTDAVRVSFSAAAPTADHE